MSPFCIQSHLLNTVFAIDQQRRRNPESAYVTITLLFRWFAVISIGIPFPIEILEI